MKKNASTVAVMPVLDFEKVFACCQSHCACHYCPLLQFCLGDILGVKEEEDV